MSDSPFQSKKVDRSPRQNSTRPSFVANRSVPRSLPSLKPLKPLQEQTDSQKTVIEKPSSFLAQSEPTNPFTSPIPSHILSVESSQQKDALTDDDFDQIDRTEALESPFSTVETQPDPPQFKNPSSLEKSQKKTPLPAVETVPGGSFNSRPTSQSHLDETRNTFEELSDELEGSSLDFDLDDVELLSIDEEPDSPNYPLNPPPFPTSPLETSTSISSRPHQHLKSPLSSIAHPNLIPPPLPTPSPRSHPGSFAPPTLTPISKRKTFNPTLLLLTRPTQKKEIMPNQPLIVGRDEETVDCALSDPYVSPQHCRLLWSKNHWIIEDLKSRNGTWMGLLKKTSLMIGESFRIGHSLFCLKKGVSPSSSLHHDYDSTPSLFSYKHLPVTSPFVLSLIDETGRELGRYPLKLGVSVIGRGYVDISIPDPLIQLKHASILVEEHTVWIQDLESENGVWKRIEDSVEIEKDALINVGETLLYLKS